MRALGVVLHEMIVGRRPFDGTSVVALTSAIQLNDPQGLPERVTPVVRQVVQRCLAKDPNRRYQGAAEVRAALEAGAMSPGESASASEPARIASATERPTPGWRSAAALISVVLVIALSVAFWLGRGAATQPSLELDIDSIAVLPLANLSGDPDEDFFADGMTEALIGDLSKVGSLTVISRTSVMEYRETTRTLPEIAQELGVDAVVEVSVQRSGDRVRITARLIHAGDQRNLWTESYDRAAQDVLTLQSDMARTIVEQVQARLTPEEEERLASRQPIDPELHNLYLLGRHNLNRNTGESIDRAIGYFQQAVAQAPGFALGFAGLANAYREGDTWGGGGGLGAHAEEVRTAARRALDLDSGLAEAHQALASIRYSYDWDFSGAENAFLRVIELNSNLAQAHQGYGFLLTALGRHDEAVASALRGADGRPAVDEWIWAATLPRPPIRRGGHAV